MHPDLRLAQEWSESIGFNLNTESIEPSPTTWAAATKFGIGVVVTLFD
jgi:hypothetical protein